MNEIVLKTPKHACDVGSVFTDPENSFKEYFRIICTRKINVVLLVLKGTVEYAPLWYDNLSVYYSTVFRDAENINQIALFDDSAIFALYKRHILSDIDAWYQSQIKERKEESILNELLSDLQYIPVLITMVWALYESELYKKILRDNIIIENHVMPKSFPVFFKYMISWVLYRGKRIPLFVVFLGTVFDNLSCLQREKQRERVRYIMDSL